MNAHEAKNYYFPQLMRRANVIGAGVGLKDGRKVITTLVTQKVPENALASWNIVPKYLCDIPTDVVEVGVIQAPPPFDEQAVWTGHYRPAPGGVSIGHKSVTAGTLGCIVERDGVYYILSNNHVVANSNDAKVGDAIYQPGRADGGTDVLAHLSSYVPLSLTQTGISCSLVKRLVNWLNRCAKCVGSSHRLAGYRSAGWPNYVDAAIAEPIRPDAVTQNILEIGIPLGVGHADLGMEVQKSGRTTGFTMSVVEQVDVSVQVQYGWGQSAFFNNQIITSAFSAGGDSGSAILDLNRKVVGLLFAGSHQVTIINPIELVLELLNVRVPL